MAKRATTMRRELVERQTARIRPRTDLGGEATRDITAALNGVLADVFALYVKTKNFHWHVSGPHFRDFHLLLDEQAEQIFAMSDPLAERVRKIGGLTIRSIGEISRMQRVLDNDAEYVDPIDMLAELRDDNRSLVSALREAHNVCEKYEDVASASLIEVWIDESERRAWFLFEASGRSTVSTSAVAGNVAKPGNGAKSENGARTDRPSPSRN
ncbi:MAG TPA: DNA starvation/stationary phase protection protein [Gemmatimonadaceae bacterium]|nr:DNA starvation/stationary phase protection protein [Gemmatimonadaceae bacterium]